LAWDEALAADRPVILEVRAEAEVAPFPPHLTLAQTKAFMSSIIKGDKGSGHMLTDTAQRLLREVVPGTGKD